MRWLTRRILQGFITIIAVITISFALIRLMPGGPLDYLRGVLIQQGLDAATVDARLENYTSFQQDAPIYIQYIEYVTSILTGDFGESYWYGEPVSELLFERLPWTVFVSTWALVISFVINVLLGALMAYREGSRFDTSFTLLSVVSTSVPFYVAALVFIWLFVVQFSVLPGGGHASRDLEAAFSLTYLVSVVRHALLPIFSAVIIGLGGGALVMRGNSIRVLGSDYIRVARLRGLSERTIAFGYVGRNAILPMYTNLVLGIAGILGGSIILEQIFTYPGVGLLVFTAVEARDYPLLMGAFLLFTVVTVVMLFIADLTYSKLDPRADLGGENSEAY